VQTIRQSLFISTISHVPMIIMSVVAAVQAMLLPAEKLSSASAVSLSAARFMDPDTVNAGVLGLVGRLDLFGIWIIVLMGIGLSVLGKVDRVKAWIAAAAAWVVAVLPFLIPAFLAS
jgi:hypothetical protein